MKIIISHDIEVYHGKIKISPEFLPEENASYSTWQQAILMYYTVKLLKQLSRQINTSLLVICTRVAYFGI